MSEGNNNYDNNNYENNNYENQNYGNNNYDNQGPMMNGQPYQNGNYGSGKGSSKSFGIASLVCGIISLLGCCGLWYLSVPCAIAAIALGIVQMVKNEPKGLAIAGIICGAIGLIISIVVVIGVMYLLTSGIYFEMLEELGMSELYFQ